MASMIQGTAIRGYRNTMFNKKSKSPNVVKCPDCSALVKGIVPKRCKPCQYDNMAKGKKTPEKW